jgi:hypothetical protein
VGGSHQRSHRRGTAERNTDQVAELGMGVQDIRPQRTDVVQRRDIAVERIDTHIRMERDTGVQRDATGVQFAGVVVLDRQEMRPEREHHDFETPRVERLGQAQPVEFSAAVDRPDRQPADQLDDAQAPHQCLATACNSGTSARLKRRARAR